MLPVGNVSTVVSFHQLVLNHSTYICLFHILNNLVWFRVSFWVFSVFFLPLPVPKHTLPVHYPQVPEDSILHLTTYLYKQLSLRTGANIPAVFWHTPNNHDAALFENDKMWLAPWRSWREQKNSSAFNLSAFLPVSGFLLQFLVGNLFSLRWYQMNFIDPVSLC